MAERKPLVLLTDVSIGELPMLDHVSLPRGTLSELNAIGLGVGNIGAKAQCTDWAGGTRTVFWTGASWQAENNYATAIKMVSGIADDSTLTNAAPPSGVITPYIGAEGVVIALDASANNTKWGGFWEYNNTGVWTRARGFEEGALIPNPTLFMVDGDASNVYALRRGSNPLLHQTALGISLWVVDTFLILGGGGSGLTHQEVMARSALGALV